MTVAGSPGMRWMSRNTPTVTSSAVGTIRPRRRTTYSTTSRSPGSPPCLALPDLREAVDPVGDQGEALHLAGRDLGRGRVGGEDVRRVADDDPLGLLVDLLALGLVGGGPALLEQLVHLRVRVQAVVEAAAGVEEGVQVAVRVDAPRPAGQRRLELVLHAR